MKKITIELTEEQLAAIKASGLLEEEEEKGGVLWEPKIGERYHTPYDVSGGTLTNEGDHIDEDIIATGCAFKTQEEAENFRKWLVALHNVRKYIAKEMPFEADWSDEKQAKWAPCLKHGKLGVDGYRIFRQNPLPIHVATYEDGVKLNKDCHDDLMTLFTGLK